MLQVVVSGLVTGSLYALAGLGLVVVYRTSRVVNFALGDMATLATFVGFTLLMAATHLPYWLVLLVALVAGVAVALLMERLVVRPMMNRPTLTVIIATLAVAMIINGLNGYVWGDQANEMPAPLTGNVHFLGVVLGRTNVLGVALAVLCVIALMSFFRFNRYGIAMAAVSQNPFAARLVGIPVERLAVLSWGVGGALGALSGMMMAPTIFLSPNSIDQVMIYGFAVVVMGGFLSAWGAIVGGLVLGVFTSLMSAYMSINLENTTIFLLILVLLLIRPQGLFGRTDTRAG